MAIPHRCYYDNELCLYLGGLWECKTCGDRFCHFHEHSTSLGDNVECVACEYARRQQEED